MIAFVGKTFYAPITTTNGLKLSSLTPCSTLHKFLRRAKTIDFSLQGVGGKVQKGGKGDVFNGTATFPTLIL